MNALLLKNINDMKGLKNILAEAFWIVLFAVIALVYFYPADFDGRRLTRHDNGAADGLGVEINQYRDNHDGETPRWTNSVFGGMPTYQIDGRSAVISSLSLLRDISGRCLRWHTFLQPSQVLFSAIVAATC